MQISKFEDGLRKELAALEAKRPDVPLSVEYMLHDRTVSAANLGKLVGAMQVSPEDAAQAGQRHAGTKLLYNRLSDGVVFDLVEQTPSTDGSYAPYARIELSQQANGQWQLNRFISSLDPSGFEKEQAKQYVDLTDHIKDHYKQLGHATRFAADFLTAAVQGNFMWDALVRADLHGHIDGIFEDACKAEASRLSEGGTPLAPYKSRDGHYPGTFDYFADGATKHDNRQSVAPVQTNRRP